MTSKTEFSTPSTTEIKVVRRFSASQQNVWAVWTQAEHLHNWWGPEGWSMPFCQLDFRPGGNWSYCMQGPDMQSWSRMTYVEIDAPRRFSSVEKFVDADGNPIAEMPAGESIIEFEQTEGETVVSATTCYGSREARDQVIEMGVEASIAQMFERLDAYLASLT